MQSLDNENMSVAQWASICNIPQEQFLGQVKVLVQELTEILDGVVKKNPQEVMDGVTDVDWMFDMVNALLDKGLNSVLGNVDFASERDELHRIIESVYPGLMEQYFEDFKTSVLESNYSKFCTTEEDAGKSVLMYSSMGVEAKIRPSMGYYVIYSVKDQVGSDGVSYSKDKILKGINYKKPDLVVEYEL